MTPLHLLTLATALFVAGWGWFWFVNTLILGRGGVLAVVHNARQLKGMQ